MFGYIRPFREELKVREFENYQALYCGLCHTISERCGFFASYFLTYDFTFLAMVLSAGEKTEACRRRCAASPLQGKPACRADAAIETAADETVILAYWKLLDNIEDSGLWKGLAARILAFFLRPAYRKAAAFRPAFDRQVKDCLAELHEMEEQKCASMDAAADTFARILKAAAPDTGDEKRDRPVGQLLYHVGRWIYLVDAWDDLEEDRSRGRYNPVALRFPGGEGEALGPLRTTLRHSINLLFLLTAWRSSAAGATLSGISSISACRWWRSWCLPAVGARRGTCFPAVEGITGESLRD
jgi:hypothetical protein